MAKQDQVPSTADKPIAGAMPNLDMGAMLASLHRNFDATICANRALHEGLIDVVRRQGEVISEFLTTSESTLRELNSLGVDPSAHPRRTATLIKMMETWMSHAHQIGELLATAQSRAIATLSDQVSRGATTPRAGEGRKP